MAGVALLLLALQPDMASSQLIGEPFSFPTSSGGPGMSIGGRQAILNEKLFGQRPDNLLRSPSTGELLTVEKGPGGSAFARYSGSDVFLPQFRTSFRQNDPSMAAGIFNGFFLSSIGMPVFFPNPYSGASVSTWTARVSSGMPVSYGDQNVVDEWTSQVISSRF